jgi:hypothetical protein
MSSSTERLTIPTFDRNRSSFRAPVAISGAVVTESTSNDGTVCP